MVFRGTPVLVQIVFWSFIAALYPNLSLGIPFGHEFVIFDSNKLIPQFVGVVLGLGFNKPRRHWVCAGWISCAG